MFYQFKKENKRKLENYKKKEKNNNNNNNENTPYINLDLMFD